MIAFASLFWMTAALAGILAGWYLSVPLMLALSLLPAATLWRTPAWCPLSYWFPCVEISSVVLVLAMWGAYLAPVATALASADWYHLVLR